MTGAPIKCFWDGKIFKPFDSWWAQKANREYVAGEPCFLARHEPRSMASHSHFFAALNEGWHNLPLEWAALFPSSEHLRRYALIKSGWCHIQTFVMATPDQALQLQRVLKSYDDFSVISTKENIVTKATAKSQSLKAMGKDDFQKSKDDVLAVVAQLLGTSVKDLAANAGKSADGTR